MSDYLPVELYHWAGMPSDNLEVFSNILNQNPNYINLRNSFNDDVLQVAIRSKNIKICEYLIDNFHNQLLINAENANCNDYLFLILTNKLEKLIDVVLATNNISFLSISYKFKESLILMLENDYLDCLEYVLGHIFKLGKQDLFLDKEFISNLLLVYGRHQESVMFFMDLIIESSTDSIFKEQFMNTVKEEVSNLKIPNVNFQPLITVLI